MSINRDEVVTTKDRAEELMKVEDFSGALKIPLKAKRMDPSLPNIQQMVMVCEVHSAASRNWFKNSRSKRENDWSGILQVHEKVDDVRVKKQYKRLALFLYPNKNKFPGAESAFKLVGEAQSILLNKEARGTYDRLRKYFRVPWAPAPAPTPAPEPAPAPQPSTAPSTTQNNRKKRKLVIESSSSSESMKAVKVVIVA